MPDIIREIRAIERQEAELALAKKQLKDREKEVKAAKAELEKLVKASPYDSPRKLVEALVEHYGLRLTGKKPGRPAKSARRKRTRITPELRDSVKASLKELGSVGAVAKRHNLSYAVVAKAQKGGYDKLK